MTCTRSSWARRSRGSGPLPDPADLTLRAAAAALAAGELSSAELTSACLERAAATEDLGAFAALDARGAMAEAQERDRARSRGECPRPLHGVPVGIKDLADVAGMPTRAGAAATSAEPAATDADAVARLRTAGAVVLGKTSTHEFAYGVTARTARNPWDPERLAGGSSGGSAVAVAVGACPLTLGTDTAGSCRIPAAFCGVTGMMARPGTLPMDGIIPLGPGMDTVGLLARSAADLAVGWAALGGGPVVGAQSPARVAMATPAAMGEVSPDAAAAAERVADALGGVSATLQLPPFDDFGRARGPVIQATALATHRDRGWWPAGAGRYGEDVADELRRAEALDPGDLAAARARSAQLGAALRAALEPGDVLVMPTTPGAAPPRALDGPLARVERRHAARLTRLCGPANMAGLAAVSVFAGLDGDGLPLGVQVVARDEATALAAAQAWERVAGEPPPPTPEGRRPGHGRLDAARRHQECRPEAGTGRPIVGDAA
jgi:aspartyl-tRNA(Asn)/glutamyl-tRNA(Gln) amidotransferase subunit A